MDPLTFVASVIGSLAWPAVVVVVVVILRRPITALLPLLQKLRYRDLELDFGSRVEELSQEAARELPSGSVDALPDELGALRRLAELSPRSAVLEAWRGVELAALEAARELSGGDFKQKTLTYQALDILESSSTVDRRVVALLRDMRGLRNEAAHAPDFVFTPEAAVQYAITAAAVAEHLRRTPPRSVVEP